MKLKLLEMGELTNATKLDDYLIVPEMFTGESTKNENTRINGAKDLEVKYKLIDERYKAYTKSNLHSKLPPNVAIRTIRKEIIDSFYKTALSIRKCENCSATSATYRKDGYAKIFQKAVSVKLQKSNSKKIATTKTALESLQRVNATEDMDDMQLQDSDSEQSDEYDDDGNGDNDEGDQPSKQGAAKSTKTKRSRTGSEKYLVPLEVEAQFKLLWRNDGALLDFIWSKSVDYNQPPPCSTDLTRYELFFQRLVLVTPNRFRPKSKIGNAEALHPQSVHLTNILEANDKIRRITNDTGSSSSNAVDPASESNESAAAGEPITAEGETAAGNN